MNREVEKFRQPFPEPDRGKAISLVRFGKIPNHKLCNHNYCTKYLYLQDQHSCGSAWSSEKLLRSPIKGIRTIETELGEYFSTNSCLRFYTIKVSLEFRFYIIKVIRKSDSTPSKLS